MKSASRFLPTKTILCASNGNIFVGTEEMILYGGSSALPFTDTNFTFIRSKTRKRVNYTSGSKGRKKTIQNNQEIHVW